MSNVRPVQVSILKKYSPKSGSLHMIHSVIYLFFLHILWVAAITMWYKYEQLLQLY